VVLIIVAGHTSTVSSLTGNGDPLKYISSCELDFNNDGEPDIALLVETLRGRELIVLMKTAKGYNAFVPYKGGHQMHLSCHFGKSVKETQAGRGKKTEVFHKTPGTYIRLYQPEGAAVVYFWDGSDFKEVWVAD
jgi:hypothetical protein